MTISAVKALSKTLFVNVEQLLLEGDDLDHIHLAIDQHVMSYCPGRLEQLTWWKISLMQESYSRAAEYDALSTDFDSPRLSELDDAIEDATSDEKLIERRAGRLARALLFSLTGSAEVRTPHEREVAIDRVFRLCVSGADEALEGDDSAGRYQRILRHLIATGFGIEPPPAPVAPLAPLAPKDINVRDELDDDIPF